MLARRELLKMFAASASLATMNVCAKPPAKLQRPTLAITIDDPTTAETPLLTWQ